jgi:hypothetical protein
VDKYEVEQNKPAYQHDSFQHFDTFHALNESSNQTLLTDEGIESTAIKKAPQFISLDFDNFKL